MQWRSGGNDPPATAPPAVAPIATGPAVQPIPEVETERAAPAVVEDAGVVETEERPELSMRMESPVRMGSMRPRMHETMQAEPTTTEMTETTEMTPWMGEVIDTPWRGGIIEDP